MEVRTEKAMADITNLNDRVHNYETDQERTMHEFDERMKKVQIEMDEKILTLKGQARQKRW